MNRQSLESVIDEILLQLKMGISLSSTAPYPVFDDSVVGHAFEEAKTALLKTVDRYVEERERLARIDELESDFALASVSTNLVDYQNTLSERIKALRQQVEGGEI